MSASVTVYAGTQRKKPASWLKFSYIFQDDWTDSDDCVEIANQLCAALKLPELTTRRGLKKVHANLDNILYKLDEIFRYAQQLQDAKILSAVVAIYTKMCVVDALLQDKLVARGLFERIHTLMDSSDTRLLALRSINTMVHGIGKQMSHELVRKTPALLKVLRENLSDPDVISLVPAIFARAVTSISQQDLAAVDVRALTTAILDVLRNPMATDDTIDHALSCLGSGRLQIPSKCYDMPSYNALRVALMRSQDVRRRFQVMYWFTRSYVGRPPANTHHWHLYSTDLAHCLDKRGLPPKLQDILDKYGRDESHLYLSRRLNMEYHALIAAYATDEDRLKLGRGLVTLILADEYALPGYICNCCGETKGCALCKPKWRWLVVAKPCIEALRTQNNPDDKLFADVLEWRVKDIELCHPTVMIPFLREAIERSPGHAVLQYALAENYGRDLKITAQHREAKKGLECSDASPWIRRALLRLTTAAAWNLSLQTQDVRLSWHHALSAREDSKTVIKEGQPDGLQRQQDLYLFIFISFVVEGDKCNPLTPDIESALEQMKINEEFMMFLDPRINHDGPPSGMLRIIMEMTKNGIQEWDGLLRRIDDKFLSLCEDSPLRTKNSLDESLDALDAWCQKFEGEATNIQGLYGHDGRGQKPARVNFEESDATLMRCSWCNRPSTSLKKCTGCGRAKCVFRAPQCVRS
ncbi:hypothetical protein EIP86_010573 [Pleurotus ostreatoroseus]|nr:hypothetical protein EIP86_010573 [Pleurotus ostreatoroseus]